MIIVNETVFNNQSEIPDDYDWKDDQVNAVYHKPTKDREGYYVIDFSTTAKSLWIAVKRFVKACKRDPILSKKVSDIVHTDVNDRSQLKDWYEWFESNLYNNVNKPEPQIVGYEINDSEYDGWKNFYLTAMLNEI